MATEMDSLKSGDNDGLQIWLTWILTILACAYLAWTSFTLYRATIAFGSMYESMAVQLRGLTWLVFHSYRWLYPIMFGGAASLIITKQFFVRKTWMNLTITLLTAIVLGIMGEVIARALYGPVWDYTQKLK